MASVEQLMDVLAQEPDVETIVLTAYTFGSEPTAAEVAESTGLDRGHVIELTQRGIELGLAVAEQSQGHEVALTAQGRRVAERTQASYVQGQRRTEAIRRGVLESFQTQPRLSSQEVAEQWQGRPLEPAPTHDEVSDAYEFLRDSGLVKAQGTMEGVWVGIRLLNDGRDALENRHRLVAEQTAVSAANYSSHTQTFNQQGATIGAQAVGNDNTVSGSVAVNAQSLEQIRQALSQALAQVEQLPQEDQDSVRGALEDAASVAGEDQPRTGVLRLVLQAAAQAAGAAAGTEATVGIRGLMEFAMAAI